MRIRRDRIEETSGKTDTRIGQNYLLRRLISLSGYARGDTDVERRAATRHKLLLRSDRRFNAS